MMKTFLSIGTGPGIGYETARRFALAGFQIILSARTPSKVEDLATRLESEGFKAVAKVVDAADAAAVATLVESVQRDFGSIDVLHYNAAVIRQTALADQPRETFNTDLAVNIGGAMTAIQVVGKAMSERGSGSILLTGGGLATHPHPDYLSLSIGKAGVRALTFGLFDAFKASGVHVATVTVAASVAPGSSHATAIANGFWDLHSQTADSWTAETVYAPEA
jgi:short-subunit dehydrogenase